MEVIAGKENAGQEAQKKKKVGRRKRKPLRPVAQNGQTVHGKEDAFDFDGTNDIQKARGRYAITSSGAAVSGEEGASDKNGGGVAARNDVAEIRPNVLESGACGDDLVEKGDACIGPKTAVKEKDAHIVIEQSEEIAAPLRQHSKIGASPEHHDAAGKLPEKEDGESESRLETPDKHQFGNHSRLGDEAFPLRVHVKAVESSDGTSDEDARMDQMPVRENDKILPRSSSNKSGEAVYHGEISVQAADASVQLRADSFAEKHTWPQASKGAKTAGLSTTRKDDGENDKSSRRKNLSKTPSGNVIENESSDEEPAAVDASGDTCEPSKPAVRASDKLQEADSESSDEETPVVKRRRRDRVDRGEFNVDERASNDLDREFKENDNNSSGSEMHDGLGSSIGTRADGNLDLQLKENGSEVSKPQVRSSCDLQTVRSDDDNPGKRTESAQKKRGQLGKTTNTQNDIVLPAEQAITSQPGASISVDSSPGSSVCQQNDPYAGGLVDSESSPQALSPKANQDVSTIDSKPASQNELSALTQGSDSEGSDDDHTECKESERNFTEKLSLDAAHKVSKPRQERAQLTQPRRPGHLKGSVSFSLRTSPSTSPEQARAQPKQQVENEHGRPASRPQLVVGKDGMIGEASIGFLSKLASTPATSNRVKILTDAAQADAGLHRRTRLFNPTPSIYSATKRALNKSILRDVGLPAKVSRTPSTINASHPLTRNLFPPNVAKNDPGAFSSGPVLATARPSSAGSPHDNTVRETTKSAILEATQHEGQHTTIESKRGDTWDGSKLISKRELEHLTRQSRLEDSELLKSPSRDVLQTKPLFGKGQLSTYQRTIQPKTAPGNGIRSRTEGKLIKSAFRERIERLHANASLSGPNSGASAVLPSSDINLKSTLGVNISGFVYSTAKGEGGTAHSSPLEKDGGTRNQRTEVSVMQTFNNNEKVINGESQVTLSMSGAPKEPVEKGVVRTDAANADTELSGIWGNESSLGATASNTKDITEKTEILQIERITPTTPASGVSLEFARDPNTVQDDVEEKEIAMPATDATIQPDDDGNTDNEAQRSSQKNSEGSVPGINEASLEQPIQVDTQTPGTISNLVSSVTSFLPSASFLLGSQLMSKNDEKFAEEQVNLTAKKQREDAERREAELSAKREAQRIARQREAEEKQRKAENRRRLLAEAEKHREEERRRKEELRKKKRQDEEEKQRAKKEEEDRRREEHRRRVLEQKRQNDKAAQRREMEVRRTLKEKHQPSKLKTFHQNATLNRQGPANATRAGKTIPTSALPPQPPKTPLTHRQPGEKEEPQWELTNERKRGISDSSDEVRERRRRKVIPQWAKSTAVWKTLQSEKGDPDVVFARGAPSCNLESVFRKEEVARKFRPREDSGDWTKDRLTAKEEMEYKRRAGFFDNV